MLHSKRLQASWGQAPSPPARTLCARSLRSLAGSHAACATRGRSATPLCWLDSSLHVSGFRSRRRVPAPRLRFVWLSLLITLLLPLRLVGVALIAGAPAPLTGFQPSPACRRARAPAPLLGAAPYGRESGAMRPRAPLRSARKFATRQQGLSALAGLLRCSCPSPQQGRQPSPACDIFNLYLRAACGLAAHRRYAPPLNIQNKC